MKEVYCRAATLEELPILLQFEQGIVHAERPYDPTLQSGHINYYNLEELIKASDTEVIVAVSGREIIGSAYISIKKAKPYLNHIQYGYLGFMFVRPEYRGQGINKKIYEACRAWALSKDIQELRLDVYDGNTSAIRAYEKAGFKKHLVNMRIGI